MARGTQRGFTLIEMSIVIALVSLFAGFIIPNLVGEQTRQRQRTFLFELPAVVQRAREYAISQNKTVELSIIDNKFSVNEKATGVNDKGQEVFTLAIPDGVTTGRLTVDGQDSSQGEWTLPFYADGTCDQGGVELNIGQSTTALNITTRATATLDDQLVDTTTDPWTSGTYESR